MRDSEQDADGQADASTGRERDRRGPILPPPPFATPSHKKNLLVRLAMTDANASAVTHKWKSLTQQEGADAAFASVSFI